MAGGCADHFPLPYAHWYAASLFLDAGHPADQVLGRLKIDAARWATIGNLYGMLHFADTSWVASAYQRAGLPTPGADRALYDHLMAPDGPVPEMSHPFDMRRQLAELRAIIEADPHIGPFADTGWIAHYICERVFPTIRYVHDGRGVMVDGAPLMTRKGAPLDGIDPSSFRKLGERWFRDKDRVYGQGETPTTRFWFALRGADPGTFTVLNERYGADSEAGFYITNRRLPTQKPGSFEIVGYPYGRGQKPGFHVYESHYARDADQVYAYGAPIKGADAPSFHAIGDEGRYFADKSRIYWENAPIAGADRASFTCAPGAGQYRAYDRNAPYYAGKPQSVSAEFDHWRSYFEANPKLVDSWWHREKARREQADAAVSAPKPLGGPYVSDGGRVLVRPANPRDGEWVSLDYIDHATFRHLANLFCADHRGLRYVIPGQESYGTDPVKNADPGSFRALGDGWYRDDRQAYYVAADLDAPQLRIIKADMNSLTLLGGAYARDSKGLIVEGVRKRGIDDPSRVTGLGHLYARMGDVILYRGKAVTRAGKIDPVTARAVHYYLLIDDQGHMLLQSRYRKPRPGIDAASLRFLNRAFAVDRSQVYAFTWDALIRCPQIDRDRVRMDGPYAVQDGHGRFHVSAGNVIRSDLPVGGG